MKKIEIEKKYLLKNLPKLKYDIILHIFQYYLPDGSRIRETKTGWENGMDMEYPFQFGLKHKYEICIKKKIKMGVYEEDERKITEKKYDKLKKEAFSFINKTRYIYKSGRLKWEIDVYQTISMVTAEIELKKESSKFIMPFEIANELILDVTEFPQFTNKSLSNKIKKNKIYEKETKRKNKSNSRRKRRSIPFR